MGGEGWRNGNGDLSLFLSLTWKKQMRKRRRGKSNKCDGVMWDPLALNQGVAMITKRQRLDHGDQG
jgi:hypothetical protein